MGGVFRGDSAVARGGSRGDLSGGGCARPFCRSRFGLCRRLLPAPYQYRIHGSLDGSQWSVLADLSENGEERHIAFHTWMPVPARHVRLEILAVPRGMTAAYGSSPSLAVLTMRAFPLLHDGPSRCPEAIPLASSRRAKRDGLRPQNQKYSAREKTRRPYLSDPIREAWIFRSRKKRSTVDELADRVREKILSGEMPPGTRLPTTQQLAAQWGTYVPRCMRRSPP